MKIISGGQTGVDRAALDVAVARGVACGGWCPRGGWAEDCPDPPGLLARYPNLRETPLADPAQRTEWNVRDADACLVILDARGASVSKGTALAIELAGRYGKPLLIIDIDAPQALAEASVWLNAQRAALGDGLMFAIGGPRESEARGIYEKARALIGKLLMA
jgi:putative molybdenum carrier protein